MLTYKQKKMIQEAYANQDKDLFVEALTGSFTLGLRSPQNVGGVVGAQLHEFDDEEEEDPELEDMEELQGLDLDDDDEGEEGDEHEDAIEGEDDDEEGAMDFPPEVPGLGMDMDDEMGDEMDFDPAMLGDEMGDEEMPPELAGIEVDPDELGGEVPPAVGDIEGDEDLGDEDVEDEDLADLMRAYMRKGNTAGRKRDKRAEYLDNCNKLMAKESAGLEDSLLRQFKSMGQDLNQKHSSGLEDLVKVEDALFALEDPNVVFVNDTPNAPQPGEAGFAPQGRVGGEIGGGYDMDDFMDIPVLGQ